MTVAGLPVDLATEDEALHRITARWADPDAPPLGVVSINLDHVHHFGEGRRRLGSVGGVEWLSLIDGAPIAATARRLTGAEWPRLAGSDLIGPILDAAERDGVRVGFLGGADETRLQLLAVLAMERPGLTIAGSWSPSRHDITDPEAGSRLAAEVRAARVDVLVVGLGKPRQEDWIDRHGVETGARVLLAFGAVVDFLAGRVSRAPAWVARAGVEWAWRLALEPRRLARRYLIQGPGAYLAGRRATLDATEASAPLPPGLSGAVIIPAHDEAAVIDRTLSALGALPQAPRVEVIVVCNGTTDDTADRARRHRGVRVVEIPTASKIAALNEGDRLATAWPRIYLDADIEADPHALVRVLSVLDAPDAAVEAARPAFRYETAGASAPVRAYYRARARIPSFRSALWGAGVYAVSEEGHRRFAEFPALTADDLFIDQVFPPDRKCVVATTPVVVRTPRNVRSLLRILRRAVRGNDESGESTTGGTARELVRGIRGPRSAVDAAVYTALVVVARRGGRRPQVGWERDESSR